MSKRILLGIDTELSSVTQYALQTVSDLATPNFHILLLHVIPQTTFHSPYMGMYGGDMMPLTITSEQREQAEQVVRQARQLLLRQGVTPEQIEIMIRIGHPAEEIVKVAHELQVSFIVVGSHSASWQQDFRRWLFGSTSHSILKMASCPVMLVTPPSTQTPVDLIAWYTQAITQYLKENPGTLTVFTDREVAQKFLPPHKKAPGRKEIAAATRALEQLTGSGILCCHKVQGELRYVND